MSSHIDDPRARAEAQLRISEDRFRYIFENAAVGIAEVGVDGRFVTVNTKLCEITGYSRAELLERSFQEITHPDDLAADEALARRLASGEFQDYTMEKRYVRKDGSIVAVNLSASAVRAADGLLLHFIAIVEDISVRKAAEEALRSSEERFRSVFQHAATGIAITDIAGRFIQCNPAYEALVGYTSEELRHVVFSELVHPDDRSENLREISRLREGLAPHLEIENRYRRKDGTAVWVNKFVTVMRDKHGTPTHMMALVTDITERRALHDAQQQAMRQKDEFIAVLAHELRNPLAPIRTSVSLLRGVLPQDPVLVRCRDVIERQVGHMARLIDDLLDISRLSRGELRLQRGPTLMSEVIDSAMELTQPLLNQRRQRLRVEAPGTPLLIEADAARLTQVLGNLLDNASKYSPPDTEIHVSVHDEQSELLIRVKDRGVGIAASHLDRVFDMFAQTDGARALRSGGLGIGLALARRLVHMHGGTITVSSQGPGRGSEFVVRLPQVPAAAAGEAFPAPPVAAPWVPIQRRVLVADDNQDAAEMMAALFEQLDCDVRAVHDGESAVLQADQFRPDVVVLDIGMPGMDGYEACERIRREPWGASMLIVALTGWGQDSDRQRSARAGFDHHFVKPVDMAELTRFVRDTARPSV